MSDTLLAARIKKKDKLLLGIQGKKIRYFTPKKRPFLLEHCKYKKYTFYVEISKN